MTAPHVCVLSTSSEWRTWPDEPGWIVTRRCRVRRCRECGREAACEPKAQRRRFRDIPDLPVNPAVPPLAAGVTSATRWRSRAEVLAKVGGDGHQLLDTLDVWLRSGWIEVEEELPPACARWFIGRCASHPAHTRPPCSGPRRATPAATARSSSASRCGNWPARAVDRHGPLGLRTLAHLAAGDTHTRNGFKQASDIGLSPDEVWFQPDAQVQGANVVRLGGRVALTSAGGHMVDIWQRPGHFLWDWQAADVSLAAVGSRLLLVENPYPFWELLARWAGQDVTLVCIHGETRHRVDLGPALGQLLAKIYTLAPGLPTYIWCDPDPGGLAIAANAYTAVNGLGGRADFWLMDEQALSHIETARPQTPPRADRPGAHRADAPQPADRPRAAARRPASAQSKR